MLNLSALNQKLHYFFGPDVSDFVAVDGIIDGTTVIDPNEEVFNLNNPKIGSYKDYKSKLPMQLPNAALSRGIIGYSQALKIQEDDTLFVFVMANAINAALKDLTNNIGDLTGRKIWIKRLGMGKEYFRDLENAAGIEFRLYVEKLSV